MERSRSQQIICIALVLATLWVYQESLGYGFVHFDDDVYVARNTSLQLGLSPAGITWAMGAYDATWMPLTWISYLIDHAIGGLSPGGYHRTNLALHCFNAILLFLALSRLTGSTWRSGVVAAVFALHPLQVEPVAWVAGRKDLLAGAFTLAALLAYTRHVRRPEARWSRASVTALFIMGLMSKGVVATLPFLLLLLDFWPLGRLSGEGNRISGAMVRRRVIEKLPWLGLAVAATIINSLARQGEGTVEGVLGEVPFPIRVLNALVAYGAYVATWFWPSDLAVHYPHPREHVDVGLALASALGLAATTLLVLRSAKRYPHLAVGWFWFAGLLFPSIGLVEVGVPEAMADRYMYVAQIGLAVMVVFSLPEAWSVRATARSMLAVVAALILVALAITSHAQVRVWRSGAELFAHAMSVTGPNPTASLAAGLLALRDEQFDVATRHLEEAARRAPRWARAQTALGDLHRAQRKFEPARASYQAALSIDPDHAPARIRLGALWLDRGRPRQAIPHLRAAREAAPEREMLTVHLLLGEAWVRIGEHELAVEAFRDAIALEPHGAEVHANLGAILRHLGREDEAQHAFARAIELARASGDAQLEKSVRARRREASDGMPESP